jgi:predicted AAA+ superfamily ATPase
MEKLRESQKETALRMKKTDRLIGKLGNRFGEMIEHLIVPNIKEKFRALNMNFDHISQNHKITDNGRSLAEIDLLLENGDLAIAVKVKSKPIQKDIDATSDVWKSCAKKQTQKTISANTKASLRARL